jgi:hypothetical protein
MTRMDQIRALTSVAACHEWRAGAGELTSMEYQALLTRIEALRNSETQESVVKRL